MIDAVCLLLLFGVAGSLFAAWSAVTGDGGKFAPALACALAFASAIAVISQLRRVIELLEQIRRKGD